MTKPLSVAVIGAGMAGRTHANAWREGILGDVFHFDGRYWCDYGVESLIVV
ncbi:hypothetical protein [Bowdeniella nasicola]|uniref:hypothetical protein n=1 Tax=Bowdeniella nasicola TaxID=208480 RepID=UPI000A9A3E22|nr:hypothetical protein [Bowdeniella nasicola]